MNGDIGEAQERPVRRTIAPETGEAASLEQGLDRLAECCLGYLAAYIAAQWNPVEEQGNAYLWVGMIQGAALDVHRLTYETQGEPT